MLSTWADSPPTLAAHFQGLNASLRWTKFKRFPVIAIAGLVFRGRLVKHHLVAPQSRIGSSGPEPRTAAGMDTNMRLLGFRIGLWHTPVCRSQRPRLPNDAQTKE